MINFKTLAIITAILSSVVFAMPSQAMPLAVKIDEASNGNLVEVYYRRGYGYGGYQLYGPFNEHYRADRGYYRPYYGYYRPYRRYYRPYRGYYRPYGYGPYYGYGGPWGYGQRPWGPGIGLGFGFGF